MTKLIDLTGQKFGRLTVLGRVWRLNATKVYWLCQCDCGNLCVVRTANLRNGNTQSCGCLAKEILSKRLTKHGMYGSRMYVIWDGMKSRCQNPNHVKYDNYGGRGIVVCDEWQQFKVFYEWAMSHGYQDDLELDRIDNDKGYSPDNCRWVTIKAQANNKRNNHYITYNGETHTLKEWSEIIGISKMTLRSRINNWSIEKALTTPVQRGSNGKGK